VPHGQGKTSRDRRVMDAFGRAEPFFIREFQADFWPAAPQVDAKWVCPRLTVRYRERLPDRARQGHDFRALPRTSVLLIIPSAVDPARPGAGQAKPVRMQRPAGRTILTGLAWSAGLVLWSMADGMIRLPQPASHGDGTLG
jgi:hypothetical protein